MKKPLFSLTAFLALLGAGVLLCALLPAAESRTIGVAPAQETAFEIPVGYDPQKQEPITESYTATTVRVEDLLSVKRLEAYNYTPNAYEEIASSAVSNAQNGEPQASRGTIRYVVTNLEGISPADGNWEEALSPYAAYIGDDERLHLTLYLPPMLSACQVFVRAQHEASLGTLTGYDSSLYATTDQTLAYDETVAHKNGTEGIFLDVPLIVSSRVWNDNPIQNGCVVTIHYEAEEGRPVGFVGTPLIGPDAQVRAVVERGRTFRFVAFLLALITFFIFVFVCLLKRATAFVPQLVFAAAVTAGTFSSLALTGATDLPYLWLAVRALSPGLFLLGAALSLPRAWHKVPARAAGVLLAILSAGCSFAAPLASTAHESALTLAAKGTGAAGALLVVGFSVWDLLRGKRLDLRLNNALAAVMAGYALFFFRESLDLLFSPLMWLSLTALGVILVIGFREFLLSERQNRKLTANLAAEVKWQTQNMQQMIDEREQILQFVSHDMKKPLSSVRSHLAALRQKETGEEPLKILGIVEEKLSYLQENLSAVADYARRKYVAENPENVEVDEILRAVYKELSPDAEANGIVMALSTKPVMAFAKPDALKSVLQNLVLNAIEHAECSKIELGAGRRFDRCILTVSDNGKGLGGKDAFRPYYSGNENEENIGLGLYICKSHIEAMNGTLSYEYADHRLTFTISLPIA